MDMAPQTGLAHWLSSPQRVEGLQPLADLWREQQAVFTLSPVAPADSGFGAHLRRSFLGALGPAASVPARAGHPCPWDPPCALDIFVREQLRTGGDGLPKPYVLFWSQEGTALTVTLRVFGTACDWFPAAAEVLSAGLAAILPWQKCVHGQGAAPDILDRQLTTDAPPLALPEGPLTLMLDSPMDDSGTNPNGPKDPAAQILARAVRRVDALARWQGLALTVGASRELTSVAHGVEARVARLSRAKHTSPNRHGQDRETQVLTGSVDLPSLPEDLQLLLALASRCHLGRHTNEGLGAISLRKTIRTAIVRRRFSSNGSKSLIS